MFDQIQIDNVLIAFFIYYTVFKSIDFIILLKSLFILRVADNTDEASTTEVTFDTSSKPHISIVVPMHNESVKIFNTIQSIFSQSYKNFDLILVDDGSSNDTLERVISHYDMQLLETIRTHHIFKNKNMDSFSIISKKHSGKSDSLNQGVKYAKGQYLLFLDADTILDQNALSIMVQKIIKSHKSKVLFGSIIGVNNHYDIDRGSLSDNVAEPNLLSMGQEIEYLNSIFFQRLAFTELKSNFILSGATLLIKKSTFIEVEGFTVNTITEDLDLCMKVIKFAKENSRPYPIEYISKELSYTEVPWKISHLICQRSRWFLGLIKTFCVYKKDIVKLNFGFKPFISLLYYFLFVIPNALIYVFVNAYMILNYQWEHILYANSIIILSSSIYSLMCLLLYTNHTGFKDSFSILMKKVFYSYLYPITIIPLDRIGHIYTFFRLITNSVSWGRKYRKSH